MSTEYEGWERIGGTMGYAAPQTPKDDEGDTAAAPLPSESSRASKRPKITLVDSSQNANATQPHTSPMQDHSTPANAVKDQQQLLLDVLTDVLREGILKIVSPVGGGRRWVK